MQDMEFTVEDGKLYMLQTRTGKRTPAATFKIAVDMANEKLITKEEAIAAHQAGGHRAAVLSGDRYQGGQENAANRSIIDARALTPCRARRWGRCASPRAKPKNGPRRARK